ncbi:hypothetical protein [Nocardioides sp. AE5]|uniref:hypothetical protein n=1 Tax=Nocardioides sp. AE5 TaxID=2962573 RepID=UPI0028825F5E|nr:hypothetical protein [Nocardioides sp. AE5]MDT0200382.1 hypothetical protein [Nocardioides sp. AE5]
MTARFLAVAAVVCLALSVAACDDEDRPDAGQSTTTAGGAGTAPGTGPSGATTPESGPEQPGTPDPVSDDGDCIVGTWALQNSTFTDALKEFGGGFEVEISGRARFVAGADGSAATEYQAWTFTARMPEGEMVLVREGTDTGRWMTRPDGTISLEETEIASRVEASITAGGMTIPIPQVEHQPGELHEGVFTCSGDTLTVSVDGVSTVMQRE